MAGHMPGLIEDTQTPTAKGTCDCESLGASPRDQECDKHACDLTCPQRHSGPIQVTPASVEVRGRGTQRQQ